MKTISRLVHQPRNMGDFSAAALGPLVLVNRQRPLQSGFSALLTPPDEQFPHILLETQAARMLAACLQEVGAQGHIVPVSGWRSHKEQQAIWDDTLAREGEAFTRTYVAVPGCSEHETGLAIDLAQAAETIDFIRPELPYNGICGDFRRAASRYGFVERYRAHKTNLTGIGAEPWHFRYVGVPHAQYMEAHDLCLEEYLALLADHPLTWTLQNGRRVTVRRVTDPQTLPPADGPRQVSGDNLGGFVVTDWEAAL